TVDPSGHTNSPHPSSREGHHSTVGKPQADGRLPGQYLAPLAFAAVLAALRLPWPVMKLASSDARKAMAARWERFSSGIDEFEKVTRRGSKACAPMPVRDARWFAGRRNAAAI